jgi:hypothetical protein
MRQVSNYVSSRLGVPLLTRLRIAFATIPLPRASRSLPPRSLPARCFGRAPWFDLQPLEPVGSRIRSPVQAVACHLESSFCVLLREIRRTFGHSSASLNHSRITVEFEGRRRVPGWAHVDARRTGLCRNNGLSRCRFRHCANCRTPFLRVPIPKSATAISSSGCSKHSRLLALLLLNRSCGCREQRRVPQQ